MSALKSIIAEAKRIRKKHPKKEWKECVKEAGAKYKKSHKPKKHKIGGIKKAAKKKVVRKKAAKKKTAKKSSYHKDTKSHNVRINVVSGIPKTKTKFYL